MDIGTHHHPFAIAGCRKILVALLFAGSAISLLSCGEGPQADAVGEDEAPVSRTVENVVRETVKNGKLTNLFRTPLMEEHSYASPAYREFPRGIETTAYDDSTGMPSFNVVADYALHWVERNLWELKGNVVAVGEDGQTLYTQQLYWDSRIKKIYSNVDSKLRDGDDEYLVEGFEADEDFGNTVFRKVIGTGWVDPEPQPQQPEAEAEAEDEAEDEDGVEPRSAESEPATTTATTVTDSLP